MKAFSEGMPSMWKWCTHATLIVNSKGLLAEEHKYSDTATKIRTLGIES